MLATDLALTVTERLRRLDVSRVASSSSLATGSRRFLPATAPSSPTWRRNSAANPAFSRSTRRRCDYLAGDGPQRGPRPPRRGLCEAPGPLVRPRAVARATRTRSRSISIGSRSASPVRAARRTGIPAWQTVERARARCCCGRAAADVSWSSPAMALSRSRRSRAARTPPIRALLSPQACSPARHAGSASRPPPWVKTSLAPGSPTAERYLRRAGLLETSRPWASGSSATGARPASAIRVPLPAVIEQAMAERGLLPVAVLSGNRNFPGRVHPQLEAGFLASPPLVVAFALAGDVNRDILTDPIGTLADRRAIIRLADLWPTGDEIDAALAMATRRRRLRHLLRGGRGQRGLARSTRPPPLCSPGIQARPIIRRPPSPASARVRSSGPMRRIRCWCWATTSRPTTSRRPVRSRRGARRPSTSSSVARTATT